MKKTTTIILSFFLYNFCIAQDKSQKTKKAYNRTIGLKAGYNINKLSGQSANIKFENKSGFMVAGFISPSSKGLLGFRSELVYSRQGFSYDDNGTRQDVETDYIYLPQLTTITIAKFLQLQAGGQIGYLLKSSLTPQNSSSQEEEITEFMNRFDYGAAFGFEVYLFKGLILGSRYNISFGEIYEQQSTLSPFPFNPSDVKGKNEVLQFFAGWRF